VFLVSGIIRIHTVHALLPTITGHMIVLHATLYDLNYYREFSGEFYGACCSNTPVGRSSTTFLQGNGCCITS
jgi:hypothetical protein